MTPEADASRTAPLPLLTLQLRPERALLRKSGCEFALVCAVRVSSEPTRPDISRPPLRLALVLDRSGSMQGEKIRMAKSAALAVLDHLTEKDSAAVVIFDDQIEVLQSLARVTPDLKRQVKTLLQLVEARASTALYQGWVTGCQTLTGDVAAPVQDELARCFLLTDGIANVGETDPEQIASATASMREKSGISTSTFGIGVDYNELLLGPMAVAGGGQFHHLRRPDEIFNTFVGELGEMLHVAARQVYLELEVESGLGLALVSPFWMSKERHSIALGDLQSGEEQQVVLRVQFPAQWNSQKRTVRARLIWKEDNKEKQSDWQEVHFSYADDPIWENESRDPEAVRIASLHEADRARREAIELNNRGDVEKARKVMGASKATLQRNISASPALAGEIADIDVMMEQMAQAPMAPAQAKEHYYQQQRRSKSKADHRQAQPAEPEKPQEQK